MAQKVIRSDQIWAQIATGKYSRLTIKDKEAGDVHYDTDKDCMYLGAPAICAPATRMVMGACCLASGGREWPPSATELPWSVLVILTRVEAVALP